MNTDRNSIAYWLPKIEAAGLPTPKTVLVAGDHNLIDLLDGIDVPALARIAEVVRSVGDGFGWPLFLRTGHLSGKHSWAETCFVPDPESVETHICRLVEESALAGFFGLPTDVFAAREMLTVSPICECVAYGGMPVVREFRFFASDEPQVEHVQPYWPRDAVEQGRPLEPLGTDWRAALTEANWLSIAERELLGFMACAAAEACGGRWSVDFLQDAAGAWWLTDMALAEESFRSPGASL